MSRTSPGSTTKVGNRFLLSSRGTAAGTGASSRSSLASLVNWLLLRDEVGDCKPSAEQPAIRVARIPEKTRRFATMLHPPGPGAHHALRHSVPLSAESAGLLTLIQPRNSALWAGKAARVQEEADRGIAEESRAVDLHGGAAKGPSNVQPDDAIRERIADADNHGHGDRSDRRQLQAGKFECIRVDADLAGHGQHVEIEPAADRNRAVAIQAEGGRLHREPLDAKDAVRQMGEQIAAIETRQR